MFLARLIRKNTVAHTNGCLSLSVRNWEASLLQTHKLACHRFVDAGRRQETRGSETTHCVLHGAAGGMSISPPWFLWSPGSHGGHVEQLRWMLPMQ